MENRSLEEFQNDDSRNETAPTEDAGVKTESTPPSEMADLTAAQPTMDWTPDGGVCADCGETVQRRWNDTDSNDERLVCLACKQWD